MGRNVLPEDGWQRDALDRGRSIVDGHLLLPVHRTLVETLRGQRHPAAADTRLASIPAPLPPAAAAHALARAEADRGDGRADAGAWVEVADRWAAMVEIHQAAWARPREAEAHLADRHRAPAATAQRPATRRARTGPLTLVPTPPRGPWGRWDGCG